MGLLGIVYQYWMQRPTKEICKYPEEKNEEDSQNLKFLARFWQAAVSRAIYGSFTYIVFLGTSVVKDKDKSNLCFENDFIYWAIGVHLLGYS